MANEEHLAILRQGVEAWAAWRLREPAMVPDLAGADLREADLTWAHLSGADLREADLAGADLTGADLTEANLTGANLIGAHLIKANLTGATLVETQLEQAWLTGCRIYGISAWNVVLDERTQQTDLVITPVDEPTVTVDDLEVAQFVYLLLHNEKIRSVIDTVGKKGVLLLGRFTPERKAVLDALRTELRRLGYVPMLFDFERPAARDFTETILTLAGLCRFIIADITNPKSSPLELQATVPDYMVPFVPIIQEGERPFPMLADLQSKYGGEHGWVLDLLRYDTPEQLIRGLEVGVIAPALKKHEELILRKTGVVRERSLTDLLAEAEPPSGDQATPPES